jgi:hypothetical protein
LKRPDGTTTPYSLKLTVIRSGADSATCKINVYCDWRGEGVLNGERIHVIMRDENLTGTPGDAVKDRILIQPKILDPDKRPLYIPFSSIIKYRGVYYKTVFDDKTSVLKLIKSDVKTGKLKVQVPLTKNIEYEYISLSTKGVTDEKMVFNISTSKTAAIELPAADYLLTKLRVLFKDKDGYVYSATVHYTNQKKLFGVKPDVENSITMGKPIIRITAVIKKNRYKTPDAQLAECKWGDKLFFNVKIEEENGEEYLQLFRYKDDKYDFPVMKILDSKGKQVANKIITYG